MDKRFDIVERANLGLHYLTAMTDRELGYLPYWVNDLHCEPPLASHTRCDDSELVGSWLEAIILARKMTGNVDRKEVDEGLKKHLLSNWCKEGLRCNARRPWSPFVFSNLHEQAYILRGLVTWYLEEGNNQAREKIDGMISCLRRVAICEDEVEGIGMAAPMLGRPPGEVYHRRAKAYKTYYFPQGDYYPGTGWEPARTDPYGDILYTHCLINPLATYYEATRDEAAYDLTDGLVNHITIESEKFGYDGRFQGFFHGAMWINAGILRFALATGRTELVEWAKRVYDYARTQGGSFGWYPELIHLKDPSKLLGTGEPWRVPSEPCSVSDMVENAILLAKAGHPEYRQDAEKIVRNHLIEQQLIDTDGVKAGCPADVPPETEQTTYDNVLERMRGSWCTATRPNDLHFGRLDGQYEGWEKAFPDVKARLHPVGCCASTVPRALYLAWQEGVGMEEETTTELEEREEVINGETYSVTWRGNTVVGIKPEGTKFPMYTGRA